MTPAKVLLEVTATQYTWTVLDESDVIIAEQTMERTPNGTKSTTKASVFNQAVGDEDLLEAIELVDAYDIMVAL